MSSMWSVSVVPFQTRIESTLHGLLAGLIDARAKSEARLKELSRSDILKSLTGKSALDNAIGSTQRMIDSLDRVLRELREKLSPDEIALLDEIDRA